ncbi:MAG: carboxypeptidase regulatory-like domain-containing protein [Planctomycetes bacterium]|nr:carboxypeptidase regulatory-like domain-containing protein [Planctomycetota bacterium]
MGRALWGAGFVLGSACFLLALSEPGSEPAGSVRGHVTAAGVPLPGAEVTLSLLRTPSRSMRITAVESRKLVTDDRGHFEFDDVAPGLYRVAALGEGWALSFADAERRRDERSVDLNLDLSPGVPLTGVVTSASLPVAGVRVSLWAALPGTGFGRLERALREGVTDDAGRFSFSAVPRHIPLVLLFRSERHRARELRLPSADTASRDPWIVDLDPGNAMTGFVHSTDGSPLAGAWVSAVQGEAYVQEVQTDEAGRFMLGGLADRAGTLWVRSEGFVTQRVATSPGPGDVRVTLLREGGLSGFILLEGASTLVVRQEGMSVRRALGTGGSFICLGLAPGEARISVEDGAGREMRRKVVIVPEGSIAEVFLTSSDVK